MPARGGLTTHVLDTVSGRPAAGVAIELRRDGALLCRTTTNADGRIDAPLLAPGELEPGTYELVFGVGAYFAARGVPATEPPFLDDVPVRFGVGDPGAHHHVPLIVTPWSYSTYRGS